MKFFQLKLLLIISFILLSSQALADSHRMGFTLSFQGIQTNLSIITTSVMPGASLRIQTIANGKASHGKLNKSGNNWTWVAPDTPGRAELEFEHAGEVIKLNAFILTPFSNGLEDSLNGFRIGRYARELFRGLDSYAAPKGFIDLSSGPADLLISPNFTLGQFICKQQPGHEPTYLLVRTEMLIKLETLLEAANARGWEAETFFIMSGFRTPHYNRSIGNTTTSSRHLYGGAADIWIDNDGDGQMDDLNNDGKITIEDARELAKLAESLASEGRSKWPRGGIGIYRANSAHGPFVHIDARGYRARW